MVHHGSLLRAPRAQLEQLLQHLRGHALSSSTLTTAAITTAGAGLAVITLWILRDYHAWKIFGTGGTPPTPGGYWRMTKIRISRIFAKDSLTDPSPLSVIGRKYLTIDLPDKTSQRPKSQSRTMPQRQHPMPIDPQALVDVHALPRKYADAHPNLLKLDLSATEGKSTDAIYAADGLSTRNAAATDRILKDEIAHVHPAENSLHVWMSEPDARMVVARGWGERFPLKFVHPGWVFVYAPQTVDDVKVIEEIIKAGIAFVTGQTV